MRSGRSFASLAVGLQRAGLIRNARLFVLYARLRGFDGHLKPGRYRLAPGLSSPEIARRLATGFRDDEGVVTLWAGQTVPQVAAALQAAGSIADAAAFEALARGPAGRLRCPFPLPPTGLEGYLAPDTYDFDPNTPPEAAAQAMLDGFVRRFYEPNRGDIARSGRSVYDIVTVASMVQREAGVDDERPRIAGVIMNRLARGMRLQVDATVLYALGKHKPRLFYSDLRVDSPYNTYRRSGLPPGPIASPSIASLEAALRPESHDFLYYVLSGEPGRHAFAATAGEHQRNVAAYRAWRSRKEAADGA